MVGGEAGRRGSGQAQTLWRPDGSNRVNHFEAAKDPCSSLMPDPTIEKPMGWPRRWVEPRRLSARGVEWGCQALEDGGADPVPRGGEAKLLPSISPTGWRERNA